MLDKFEAENKVDAEGNPAGGSVHGAGLKITWQDGPLGRFQNRHDPTGAFVETVLAATIQRLAWYQAAGGGKFKCRENAIAITKIQEALFWLNHRTQERQARGVEGTLEP